MKFNSIKCQNALKILQHCVETTCDLSLSYFEPSIDSDLIKKKQNWCGKNWKNKRINASAEFSVVQQGDFQAGIHQSDNGDKMQRGDNLILLLLMIWIFTFFYLFYTWVWIPEQYS